MSLPKLTHSPEQCCECVSYLETMLELAWKALVSIDINGSGTGHWKDDGHCGACMAAKAKDAMRRIEELGK